MTAIKTYPFDGGIHPEMHKELSNASKIKTLDAPDELIIPVSTSTRYNCASLVQVGDIVQRFQKLTEPVHPMAVASYAPVSGVVVAVEPRPFASALIRETPSIVIRNDHQYTSLPTAPAILDDLSREEIHQRIDQAGIQGQGGAGFSTSVKTSAASIHTLIINATECEPYITADDRLMRDRADDIIIGVQCVAKCLGIERIVLGSEDNKPEAVDAISLAADTIGVDLNIGIFETKYPSGGEKQLIQLITGNEVQSGELPAHQGILVLNVGTLAAIKRAVIDGEPTTRRIITLTGDHCQNAGNYDVVLGTELSTIATLANIDQPTEWILGGPMMGIKIESLASPVTQISNCLLARKVTLAEPEMPCIRCSACAEACPAQLLPQQLLWHAKSHDEQKLNAHNLFDCIECGACDYVCPSNIPLVQYYRAAKDELRNLQRERDRSDHARTRFEARKARLERLEEEKAAKREARKLAAAKKVKPTDASAKNSAPGLMASALAKAGASKAPALSEDKLQKQIDTLTATLAHTQDLIKDCDEGMKSKLEARCKNTQVKIDQAKSKLAALRNDQGGHNA